MSEESIMIGLVVRDSFGRVGIVCSSELVPPEDWINEQLNVEEIRSLGTVDWWGVMPLVGGGYLLCPGPMLVPLRPTSYEDFLAAVDSANISGREALAKLFPEYVNRLLGERRTRGIN